MVKVREILENLCLVEGVKGAFLVEQDGKVKEQVQHNSLETDEIKILISSCLESGNEIAEFLGDSPLKQCIIEYSDLNLTLNLINNDLTLALVASSGANLGRIRLEIRKTKKAIEDILN